MATEYDFELLDALFERGQLGSTMPPYVLKDVYLDPIILHSLLRTTTCINILRTFLSLDEENCNIVYKGYTLDDILRNKAFTDSSPFSQRVELVNWLKINYPDDYKTALFILQDYRGLEIRFINCYSDNPLPMTEMWTFSCWTYVHNSYISELQYSNYTGSTRNYLFENLQGILVCANNSYLRIGLKDGFLIRNCVYHFDNSQVTLHGNGDAVHNSLFTNLPYKGLTDLLHTYRYTNRGIYNYLEGVWGSRLLDNILEDEDSLYDSDTTVEVFNKVVDTYRDLNLLFISDLNVVISTEVPEKKFEALKGELGQRFNGICLTNVAKASPLQIEHIFEKMKWVTRTSLGLSYSKLVYLDSYSSNPAVTMSFDKLPGHKELYIQHNNPRALLNVAELPDLVDLLEKELHLSRGQYVFVVGDPIVDIGMEDDKTSLSVSAKTSYRDMSISSCVLAARLLMLKEVSTLPTGTIYK